MITFLCFSIFQILSLPPRDSSLPESSLANEVELLQENAIEILKKIARLPKNLSFLSDDLQLGSFEKDEETKNVIFTINDTIAETDSKSCLKNLLTFEKMPTIEIPTFLTSALFQKYGDKMANLIDYGKNFIEMAKGLKKSYDDKAVDPLMG